MSTDDKAALGQMLRRILSALVHLHEDGRTSEQLLAELSRMIEKFDS